MAKPKVDEGFLEKVAQNARLNLSKVELKKLVPEIKECLDFFSKIDELDADSEEPSFQPIETKNVFREDKVKESLSQEEALSNTKLKKDGYFKGPKVVE